MEPDDLEARIEEAVNELAELDLSVVTFEELAEKHVNLRAMITENNARQKAADIAIKTCTTAIEENIGLRLTAFGAKSVVVPSGRFVVTNAPKIVYNTTDQISLLHWAVQFHKEHLLSVSLVSSACVNEFENEQAPVTPPEFIVRVELDQTKVTRN